MRIPHPKGYLCPRAAIAPNINGDLSKEFWRNAPWSDDFVDIEGDVKPRPTWRTRMKMLWDDNNLYIAAELTEPNVWATITQHDAVIFQDNDFEVFIDPDGDNHEYYELELNALNTTWDLRLVKPYRDEAGRSRLRCHGRRLGSMPRWHPRRVLEISGVSTFHASSGMSLRKEK
jgi:hypothetical protein